MITVKKYKKVRKAFSLIEVILVLVILGIVSSIGSSIIVQVYESYIVQNALYKVSTKTELVANQLVNRLSYSIPSSTISKVTNNDGSWDLALGSPIEGGVGGVLANDSNWIRLKNIMWGTSVYRTIEWIGYDNDSFSAATIPGWSGVSNYSTASENNLSTPGSDLALAKIIMTNLSEDKVQLTEDEPAALFFKTKGDVYKTSNPISRYSPSCMGLIDINTSCVFPVRIGVSNTELVFPNAQEKRVSERYALAWSAYAVVPENPTDIDGDGIPDLWDLFLYYNYQPWNNENYKDHGSKKLLMHNVSVFKFTKNGGVIQFKLCASSQISSDNYISTCKEKVVLR